MRFHFGFISVRATSLLELILRIATANVDVKLRRGIVPAILTFVVVFMSIFFIAPEAWRGTTLAFITLGASLISSLLVFLKLKV